MNTLAQAKLEKRSFLNRKKRRNWEIESGLNEAGHIPPSFLKDTELDDHYVGRSRRSRRMKSKLGRQGNRVHVQGINITDLWLHNPRRAWEHPTYFSRGARLSSRGGT